MQRDKENSIMGKTRDLFKKIGDIKGIFHATMGMVKDRNGKGLTEAENIKNKGKEYPEELYKKDLNDLNNHDVMVTHLGGSGGGAASIFFICSFLFVWLCWVLAVPHGI